MSAASAVADVFIWGWTSLTASYAIPVWAIIIGSTFVLSALMRFLGKLRDKPAYRRYVEDNIDGVVWRWSWSWLWSREVLTVSMKKYCPKCDAELICVEISGHEGAELVCERCPPDPDRLSESREWRSHRVVGKVTGGGCEYAREAARREITRRVRTDSFSNKDRK